MLAGLWVCASPVMADEALDLLSKMRIAVHTINYSGTLVYAQGNDLSTYQINHAVDNGAEKENVIRLTQGGDGSGGGNAVESFSLAKFQQVQPQMEQVYAFDLGGDERVAGHVCRVVVARPRDRMRYLQRYCIDPGSGMLLKYSLIDQTHNPVEQMMFTALDLAQATQATDTVATANTAQVSATVAPSSAAAVAVDKGSDGAWSFGSLPAGFQQVKSVQLDGRNGQPPVQQFVLSDGMSSVSVFIAPPGNESALKSVEYSAGAMNIFTARVDQHNVIMVGEVPVATLKNISEGLRHGR